MENKQKIRRAWHCDVSCGGDTREDMIQMLQIIIEYLESGGNGPMAQGGCSSGGHIEVTHNPEMTRERYFEELDKR